MRSCLLLEMFDPAGRSARLYWAGKGNRIERNYEGVLCTFSPHLARQIPLEHRELAEGLAAVLNSHEIEYGHGSQWRVMDHGFMDGPIPDEV